MRREWLVGTRNLPAAAAAAPFEATQDGPPSPEYTSICSIAPQGRYQRGRQKSEVEGVASLVESIHVVIGLSHRLFPSTSYYRLVSRVGARGGTTSGNPNTRGLRGLSKPLRRHRGRMKLKQFQSQLRQGMGDDGNIGEGGNELAVMGI